MAFKKPEQYLIKTGVLGIMNRLSKPWKEGAFLFDINGHRCFCIASDGEGWEHVSAHMISEADVAYTPSWEQMCVVKGVFWDPEDCAIQYHPAEKDYVNCHPHTLHLWRPVDQVFPTPPPELVGPVKR